MNPITPAQTRAARALLGWTQPQLAEAAGLGLTAICGFEAGSTSPRASTLTSIQSALQNAGVIFDMDGQGVRLGR